jgi:hypothetical protein
MGTSAQWGRRFRLPTRTAADFCKSLGNACPTTHHMPVNVFIKKKLELADQLSGAGVSACQPLTPILLPN